MRYRIGLEGLVRDPGAGHPTVPIGDNLSRPSASPPVLSGVETQGAFSESPLA